MNTVHIQNLELLFEEKTNEIIVAGKKGIVVPLGAEILWNIRTGSGNCGIPRITQNGIKYKFCPNCRKWVALCYFYNDKTKSGQRVPYCVPCHNELSRKRKLKKQLNHAFGGR
jgi:hypothetical protein